MPSLRAVLRKIVPGVSSAAVAVGVATLAVSVVNAEIQWLEMGATMRVGLPAFLVGMLLFPVNEKTLASRIGFSLRMGFAAAVSALAHRVLWTALEMDGVIDVLRNPSSLWPEGSPDTTALMAGAAVAGATAAAFLAQPLLKRYARGQRKSVASALAEISSTGVRTSPPMVRTR